VVGTATANIYFECTTSGTAGASEPTWNITPAATTNDGSVVWTTRALVDSTICGDIPDVTYNLGVPAPINAPTTSLALTGVIAGFEVSESTQQSQSSAPPQTFTVTSDGSSQTLTASIGVAITTNNIITNGSIEFQLWRDTKTPDKLAASTIVLQANWDDYKEAIPWKNESGLIQHSVTLTETVALPVGDHIYSVGVQLVNVFAHPVPGSITIGYRMTYAGAGVLGGGLTMELTAGETNPFTVGDSVLISGVVGVANSNFEQVNGLHTVTEVGGNTIGFLLPGMDAADYLSGGAWEYVPNELNTFKRFYVYTYIARMGTLLQEGPPSPVSTLTTTTADKSVTLSGMSVPPANYNISRIRIYRTVLGNSSAEFKFVDEIGASNTTYIDTLPEGSTNIGELLQSEDWGPPPVTLHSIAQMPNGIMVGLSTNEIFVSEPFQPHAWPDKYRQSMEYDGVSTGVFGNTVLVTTKGLPYLLTGNDPANMQMDRLELSQSCVSRESTVDMGYSVLYASPDGLAQVGPGIARLVTESLFTKDEWSELNPSSIRAARWDDRYVAFYTKTDGSKGGFVFDPKNAASSYTTLTTTANAAFTDPESADLFLVDSANNIVKFDANAAEDLQFLWLSKRFHLPRPLNFGAAQVIADAYPVGFTLYSIEKSVADSIADQRVVRHTRSVQNNRPFRLPPGFTSDEYQVEITGNSVIESVNIAETLRELNLI
jgi:hypothetical protein